MNLNKSVTGSVIYVGNGWNLFDVCDFCELFVGRRRI